MSLAINFEDGIGPATDAQELCDGVQAMWRGTVSFYIDPSWNAIKQRLQESVLQILELASSFLRVEQVQRYCGSLSPFRHCRQTW